MNGKELVIDRLKQKLVENKLKNPRYSIRAFARWIQVSPGTLSLVILGKREISLNLAQKIMRALELNAIERAKIAEYFEKENIKTDAPNPHTANRNIVRDKKPSSYKLNENDLELISKPYFLVLLNLVETKDFKIDLDWMSGRIQQSKAETAEAWLLLQRLGMVQILEDGRPVRTYAALSSNSGRKSQKIRQAHLDTLQRAQQALLVLDQSQRDFTSVTMPVQIQRLPEMQLAIRKFHDEFVKEFCEKNTANEVARICIHLFPETGWNNK